LALVLEMEGARPDAEPIKVRHEALLPSWIVYGTSPPRFIPSGEGREVERPHNGAADDEDSGHWGNR
ncbi:MAG: hypothetical protein K2X68_04050, partial [Novosphingobium sp.]|nr:hypothetical protein [Novosphingobium sp.]